MMARTRYVHVRRRSDATDERRPTPSPTAASASRTKPGNTDSAAPWLNTWCAIDGDVAYVESVAE
jgi:hypothetical protein